ncbi:MAG TPA: hypothetical protein VKS25_07775, partial [Solirubrobacteraceae bacterium]|nr:hypothetical protein [Solirubrobacteraceae bacterium]
ILQLRTHATRLWSPFSPRVFQRRFGFGFRFREGFAMDVDRYLARRAVVRRAEKKALRRAQREGRAGQPSRLRSLRRRYLRRESV